jgi:hypothetical protein
MSLTSAWTELIEEVGQFVWTEPLYTETPEVIEHVLMFQVALEGADWLSAAELLHVGCGTKYSAGTVPILILPPLQIMFQGDFVTVEVNPIGETISIGHIFFVSEDRLGCECIGGWRDGTGILRMDFLQALVEFLL